MSEPQATDREALHERLAEALRRSPNGPWLTLPGPVDMAPSFVDALLPVVERAITDARADERRRCEIETARSAYFKKGRAEGVRQAKAAVEAVLGEPIWRGTKSKRARQLKRAIRAALSDLGGDQ
jgi:hypothetical protein